MQELADFEKYGDKAKLDALRGDDVTFSKFAAAFQKSPTVRPLQHL
jgi:hypothetical protein